MHILWLKTELLHPVDKGGRIRTYQMLRELVKRHRVTYLTLDDGAAAPDAAERASEYCHELVRVPHRAPKKFTPGFYVHVARTLLSPLPYAVARYRSRAMREEIVRRVARGDVDLLVCDFLAPSVNVPEDLPVRRLLFQHNVEASIWERHAQVAKHPVYRALYRGQWRRMRRFEGRECARYDRVVAVSEEDAERMRRDYGVRDVASIPTGVDTEFFRPGPPERVVPSSLVFTGSMDWLPNQDAIRFLVEQFLPRLRATVPDVTLTVVGRDPPPALVAACADDPGITFTGWVEDVRPYIERAAVYVVPIRIGGGTRLKIYEAMAMEKPVVSTTVGAEGLPLVDGQHILLADSPDAFADAVVRLLRDPVGARDLASRGATYVRERFGWDRVAATFSEICEETVK